MSGKIRSPWYTNVSGRFWKVWRRDLDVYLKTWKVNLVPPLIEPVLYLLAMGFGLGGLVRSEGVIDSYLPGGPVSYLTWVAPAIVAISVLNSAFFETTYGSFVRMTYQKTFDAIVSTPLSLEEVIIGEMAWGAVKGLIYGGIVLGVTGLIGLAGLGVFTQSTNFVLLLLVLPFSLLFGLLSSALGMCCTALAPTIDSFNYATFLLITPMFLVTGTFFPMNVLPPALQTFVLLVLPLSHATIVTRQLMLNSIDIGQVLVSLSWIAVATVVLVLLAIIAMNRKLIK
ncbi:MAG: ABC transporter permease [Promethearchaeati archaeon SRVP18_Atabeyarchaeia-1]